MPDLDEITNFSVLGDNSLYACDRVSAKSFRTLPQPPALF